MKINGAQIVSVSCFDMYESEKFEYRKEVKIFGLTIKKAGFYTYVFFEGNRRISEAEIVKDKKYRVIGNKVYFYPHCEIRMSNQQMKTKYFESVEEMNVFMKSFDHFREL